MINASIEPRQGFLTNSFNTVVKCSLTSSILQISHSNGLGSFLLTRLGTKTRSKTRSRNRQMNSLELELN